MSSANPGSHTTQLQQRLRPHLPWSLLFLGIFLATHWQEVSSPTLNVDDWALVLEPIHQASLSRPGWDLVYGGLFQGSFSPFLGWLLAGFSLYACALAATVPLPVLTPPWVCLLALITAAHTYLLDLFNFSFCIGLYLLPAALSLWGAVLMGYWGGPWRPLAWWGGTALFCLAMAIYQPTGFLGVGVLGLQALALAFGIRPFPARAGLRVIGGVLAGGLAYYLWALVAMAGQAANERTGFVTLAKLLRKLRQGSVFREVYNTDVPLVSPTPQLLLSVCFLAVLVVATLWLLQRLRGRERVRRLGLLWLAAGSLTLLPFGLFLLLKSGFPSRAFALGNYGIGAFLVTVLALLQREPGSARRLSQAVVALLAVAVLLPQGAAFSKVWDRQSLLAQRDLALAQQILADVHAVARDTGLPAQRFAVLGTTGRTELFPRWSSVGQSALGKSWAIRGLFANLLGAEVEPLASTLRGEDGANQGAARAALPSCPAYPEAGSIVPWGDRLLVCLETNPVRAPGGTPPG